MPFWNSSNSVTLDRSKFYTLVQTKARNAYDRYTTTVGSVATTYMLGMMFEQSVRMRGPQGHWSKNASINRSMAVGPASTITVAAHDQDELAKHVGFLINEDANKISQREVYVGQLLTRCKGGALRTELTQPGNTEPELNYRPLPPPPLPPRPLLPALPNNLHRPLPPLPRPPQQDPVEVTKAKEWVTHGVKGNATAFRTAIDKYRSLGQYPLGADTTVIEEIWRMLTHGDPSVPAWRELTWGTVGAVPYPSSVGGMHLLKKLLHSLANNAWPAHGDPAWQDWALFFFGALIALQAFPDANKRIARTIYALIVLNAGIPFVAPSTELGKSLGKLG